MVIIIGEKNENYVKSQGLLIKLFAGNTLGSRNRAGAKGEGSIKPTEAILWTNLQGKVDEGCN